MTQSILKSIVAGAVFVTGSLFTNGVIAQNGAIYKAETYTEKGEYAKALENIREASYHEKTADKPRTWYTRAKLFITIFEASTTNPEVGKLVENPIDSAFASMKRVKELEKDEKNKRYTMQIEDPVFQTETGMETGLQARIKNDLFAEVVKYQDTEFKKAYELMIPIVTYLPKDTTNLIYIGYFANKAELFDKAGMYYEELGDVEIYNSIDGYQSSVYAYSQIKDTISMVRVIEKATKRYPQEPYFILTSVNIYINQKEYDKAIEMLEKAHAIKPETSHLITIARIYDQREDSEKAMEYYKKAFESDPQNYDIAYTLGAYYYKKALSEYNELDQKDRAVTNPKMKTILTNAALAIPYFKQTVEINDEDKSVYNALRQLYNIQNDQTNVELMIKKVEGK